MAAVLGCFLVGEVLELKELGFALAVAVILDAVNGDTVRVYCA